MSTVLSFAVLLAVMAVTPALAFPNFGAAADGAAQAQGAAQARAMGMMGAGAGAGAGMAYGMMPGSSAYGPAGLTADQFGRASYGSAAAYNPAAAMQAQRLGQMGMSAADGMGAQGSAAAFGVFPSARSAAGGMGQHAGH